jgi:ATP-dependent DNA helicase RecG
LGSVFVIFTRANPEGGPEVTGGVTGGVTGDVTREVRSLLNVCRGSMTRRELQNALALNAEENFRILYLTPALESGLIEMTIPDKPRSSKQKYRITEKGRRFLADRAMEPR